MKVKEKEAQIDRIQKKLFKAEFSGDDVIDRRAATLIFRVISRTAHFQEAGEQRRTKKSRRQMDEVVIANVGEALRVL